MKINRLIEVSHKESIGQYYFTKAVYFAINKEFGKSYEFFKEGLNVITCDCDVKNWLEEYTNSDKKLFEDINIKHIPHFEYFFVKAYIMSYEDEKKNLYLALDSIEKYLENNENEYGYYVKGKILLSLDEPEQAFECFINASSYGENPRLLYRIGRTKEQFLEENGLQELYYSFTKNPSSVCCARILKKYMKERGNSLTLTEGETNDLLIEFNNDKDEVYFHMLYEKLLESQFEYNENLPFEMEDNSPTINEFIQGVKDNAELFVELEDYEENYDQNEYDHYDSYNDYNHPDDSPYYNDALDMDQQSPEFWDSL